MRFNVFGFLALFGIKILKKKQFSEKNTLEISPKFFWIRVNIYGGGGGIFMMKTKICIPSVTSPMYLTMLQKSVINLLKVESSRNSPHSTKN